MYTPFLCLHADMVVHVRLRLRLCAEQDLERIIVVARKIFDTTKPSMYARQFSRPDCEPLDDDVAVPPIPILKAQLVPFISCKDFMQLCVPLPLCACSPAPCLVGMGMGWGEVRNIDYCALHAYLVTAARQTPSRP